MPTFLTVFALPLIVLNFISPLGAIAWLIYQGDYKILIIAAVAGFGAAFAYVIAMLPAMVILIPGGILINKENVLIKAVGYLLLSIGGFWNYILMGAWTLFVFGYLPEAVTDRSVPYLLLAYSVSTAPFAYMASKEDPNNEGAHFATLLNQFSSAALFALLLFTDLGLTLILIIFMAVVILGYVLGLFNGLLSGFKKKLHSNE